MQVTCHPRLGGASQGRRGSPELNLPVVCIVKLLISSDIH